MVLLIEDVDRIPRPQLHEKEEEQLERAARTALRSVSAEDEPVGVAVNGKLVGTQQSKADLRGILDAIAAERGLVVALDAAQALRQAMVEGRISGLYYQMPQQPHCGCVIGHLAKALGWEGWQTQGLPQVPGWHWDPLLRHHIELWVFHVRVGQTVRSSVLLRLLDGWITEWIADQRALPGDAL